MPSSPPSSQSSSVLKSSPSTLNALNANASMSPTYDTGSCALISRGAIPPYPDVSARRNRRVTSVLLPDATSSSA